VNQSKAEVVVVTGASAGLGRAIVREFAKRGAHVGLMARGRDGLEGARREVEQAGGRALALGCDVADPQAVEDAAERVENELGPIDIWVNDAFVGVFAEFKDVKPEEYRRVTEVTYLGQVWGTRAALKRMLARDRGVIVSVGSALAYRSIPLQSAYCGAKHAIRGFLASVRCELLHNRSHVKITEVHMPALNTPQFSWVLSRLPRKPQPVPPIFQPEVGARAVYYAAHHPRREFYVGRSAAMAIVGNKIAPDVADHYLAETGYRAQQYDGAPEPGRRVNLWEPVAGDHGAHGDFDSRASEESYELWADTHRKWIALGVAGAAAVIVGAVVAKKAA
jgi:NAD(P)-dependent dehydrogenase (short-subunit alcohol dehydrogenase family)